MSKIYFASDFHLGIDGRLSSSQRERQIISWLENIQTDASALYLLGDIFDYWFEYKRVVPKGFTRILGKLASLRDQGLPVYFFTGNHDMWMFNYFSDEFGIPIYRKPIQRELLGKKFYLGHGDGLGPGDHGYKFIKKVFSNPACQWLFARIHPNLGITLMQYFSGRSRIMTQVNDYLGPEREWLIQYCNRKLDELPVDYFVFGHRHIPIDFTLKNGSSRYINLGDWLFYNSYAVFDGNDIQLKFYETEPKVYPMFLNTQSTDND